MLDLKGHSTGEVFHTGWRKGLEGDHSVMMYNLIHLMPDEVWGVFCEFVTEAHPDGPITAQTLKTTFRKFDHHRNPDVQKKLRPIMYEELTQRERALAQPCLNAFCAGLRLMSDDDFVAMANWINYSIAPQQIG